MRRSAMMASAGTRSSSSSAWQPLLAKAIRHVTPITESERAMPCSTRSSSWTSISRMARSRGARGGSVHRRREIFQRADDGGHTVEIVEQLSHAVELRDHGALASDRLRIDPLETALQEPRVLDGPVNGCLHFMRGAGGDAAKRRRPRRIVA